LCKGSDGWRDKAGVAMAKIAITMIAQEQEAPALHSASAAAIRSLSLSRGQTRSPNLVSPFASVQRSRISRKEKILLLILYEVIIQRIDNIILILMVYK
jgi:hypothetical protein